MGCDYYARLVIGSPVQFSDLFIVGKTWNCKSCCKEDFEKGKLFCSNCGLKFQESNKNVATPGFKKILKKLNQDENISSTGFIKELDFIKDIKLNQSSEDEQCYKYLAIGFSLRQVFPLDEIEPYKNKIIDMCNDLGIECNIKLYTVLFTSV